MCGFTFIASRKNFNIEDISNAHNLIRYRGIDNTSKVFFKKGNWNFAAFHSRLSIQGFKVKEANQPLYDENFLMLYNGEIFNPEILNESYQEKSDTLTLWRSIHKENFENKLKEIDGFFSLLIFDFKTQKISLFRDLFGQKPIYYYISQKHIIVSSGIKPIIKILKSIGEEIFLLREHFECFLASGYIPCEEQLFENIYTLMPNSKVLINLKDKVSFRKDIIYENNDFINQNSTLIKSSLEENLSESCKSITLSDVPSSILLSEGLDSGIVASLMNKSSAFSFVDKNTPNYFYDCVQQTCNYFGHKLKIVKREEDLTVDVFKKILNSTQSVFEDPGLYSISSLINKINTNFRVLYTGDGADELFFGYPRQKFVPYLKYFYKSYAKLSNIIDLKKLSTHFDNRRLSLLINYSGMVDPNLSVYTTFFHPSIKENVEKIFNNAYDLINHNKFVPFPTSDNLQRFDITFNLAFKLLRKTDMASMYFSKEIRSPFLQNNMVNFLCHNPIKRTNNPFKPTKNFLRKYANKKNLPCSRYSVKRGFGADSKLLSELSNNLHDESLLFLKQNGYEEIIKENYLKDQRHVLRTYILKSFVQN